MDTEELLAIEELKSMSREELDKVPYDKKKWVCQGKKCSNGTVVRDYGIAPFFYLQRKCDAGWVNLNLQFWMCGKHNKARKRLEKNYDEDAVFLKIFDNTILPIDKMLPI
jgi:hypothetical protein